jgi:hypothetical protein
MRLLVGRMLEGARRSPRLLALFSMQLTALWAAAPLVGARYREEVLTLCMLSAEEQGPNAGAKVRVCLWGGVGGVTLWLPINASEGWV